MHSRHFHMNAKLLTFYRDASFVAAKSSILFIENRESIFLNRNILDVG